MALVLAPFQSVFAETEMIRVAIMHSAPPNISITNKDGMFYVNNGPYRGEIKTYKETACCDPT